MYRLHYTDDDGAVLGHFTANPLSVRQPSQIVRLGVVVTHFGIRSVDHLLDEGPSYTVTFGAESHCALN